MIKFKISLFFFPSLSSNLCHFEIRISRRFRMAPKNKVIEKFLHAQRTFAALNQNIYQFFFRKTYLKAKRRKTPKLERLAFQKSVEGSFFDLGYCSRTVKNVYWLHLQIKVGFVGVSVFRLFSHYAIRSGSVNII